MPTSSQQTNVQRAIDDVKSIFCKINEDFCQFKFKFVQRYVCLVSVLLILLILSDTQTWSLESSRRGRFEIGSALFLEMKQISRKTPSTLVSK